jgi:glycosyltransferase involved in cell wall biosynthesis
MKNGKQRYGRFAVVIPVYNHRDALRDVVQRALALGVPIFVIDDGSTDGGGDTVRDLTGVSLLRHPANRGKGEALLTGFRAAAETADWAITLDADGQHHPEDAEALMRAIPRGKRPIVVGRREGMQPAGAPWTSRFGRRFSNFWVRMAGGPVLADTQSGFRVYPLPEVFELGVTAGGYQFEIESLVRARWKGIPVIEAPVRVTYAGKEKRVSHFHPFFDFLRNTRTFSRLIFRRVLQRTG